MINRNNLHYCIYIFRIYMARVVTSHLKIMTEGVKVLLANFATTKVLTRTEVINLNTQYPDILLSKVLSIKHV